MYVAQAFFKVNGCLSLVQRSWRKHSQNQQGSQQPHKCCLTIYFWKHICLLPLQCITPSTKMWDFLVQKGTVIFRAIFLPFVWQSLQQMLPGVTEHYLQGSLKPFLSKHLLWKPELLASRRALSSEKGFAGHHFPSILLNSGRQRQPDPRSSRVDLQQCLRRALEVRKQFQGSILNLLVKQRTLSFPQERNIT